MFCVARVSEPSNVLFVAEIDAITCVKVVVAPPVYPIDAATSQSPAVRLMLVTVFGVALTKLTADPTTTVDDTISPTFPVFAASFV